MYQNAEDRPTSEEPGGCSAGVRGASLTDEHVSGAEQELSWEEGDAVEGEGLEAAGAAGQVKDPDEDAAQAEVHRPAIHDDPVVALDTQQLCYVGDTMVEWSLGHEKQLVLLLVLWFYNTEKGTMLHLVSLSPQLLWTLANGFL